MINWKSKRTEDIRTGQDRTGHERIGQKRTGQGRAEQSRGRLKITVTVQDMPEVK